MPRVWAFSAHDPVAGVTPITFTTLPDDDLSDVTSLTLMADGKVVGMGTSSPRVCASTDMIDSTDSSTNTNMPPDQHGWHYQHPKRQS